MATFLPTSGNLSFSAIKSAFSNQSALSQYRSLRWYTNSSNFAAGWYGNFPAQAIRFSDFRGKGREVQVTPGNFTFTSSQAFTIGPFNSATVTAVGGTGGQAGFKGNYEAAGQNGTDGGSTSYGPYVSSAGGAGGTGGNGALGQAGEPQVINMTAAANADRIGTSIAITIGAGGSGGIGGENFTIIDGSFYPAGRAASGNAGANGYISVVWS